MPSKYILGLGYLTTIFPLSLQIGVDPPIKKKRTLSLLAESPLLDPDQQVKGRGEYNSTRKHPKDLDMKAQALGLADPSASDCWVFRVGGFGIL